MSVVWSVSLSALMHAQITISIVNNTNSIEIDPSIIIKIPKNEFVTNLGSFGQNGVIIL